MMAAVVVISVPLIVLFLIFRKKVMAGVSRGGTKRVVGGSIKGGTKG